MTLTPWVGAITGLLMVLQGVAAWRFKRRLQAQGTSLRAVGLLSAAMLAAGLGLAAVFSAADLGIEEHGPVMWAWVSVSAATVGFFAAALARRLPTVELFLSFVPVLEGAFAWALLKSGHEGLAAPPFRALLVAPAALTLCAYFGASLGYLLRGAGRVELRMGYESLVGRRFLLSKASPVLSTVTTISVIGVALGVWLVLVSLGILAGFESDLQRKIIGANAHLVLAREDAQPFALPANMQDKVARTVGVQAVAPYLEGEVAIASYTQYTGAVLFGIDPERSPAVLTVLEQLQQGSLAPLVEEMQDAEANPAGAKEDGEFAAPSPLHNVVIGVEMAKNLNVKVGDKVRLISPVLEVLTPIGPAPKSLGFRIAAIFSSKMYEYDARYAYVSLPAARRFLDLDGGVVTGLQLRCKDPERAPSVGAASLLSLQSLPEPAALHASDWRQRNQTLFSALKLERVVAFVVLVFIILVASFSIVNTLTMSVIEKRREIAILKTMGARDVGIMKLFLVQGMLVGIFGTLIGGTGGVCTMKLLERFGFWIPGEVYYIDSLPVKLEAADVVLVILAALLIVWDFAVFPALGGSQIEPVEGLRDG